MNLSLYVSKTIELIQKDARIIIPYVVLLLLLHMGELLLLPQFQLKDRSLSLLFGLGGLWAFELIFKVFSLSLFLQARARKVVSFRRAFGALLSSYAFILISSAFVLLPFAFWWSYQFLYFNPVQNTPTLPFIGISLFALAYGVVSGVMTQFLPLVILDRKLKPVAAILQTWTWCKLHFKTLIFFFSVMLFILVLFLFFGMIVSRVPLAGPGVLNALVQGVGMSLSTGLSVVVYKSLSFKQKVPKSLD